MLASAIAFWLGTNEPGREVLMGFALMIPAAVGVAAVVAVSFWLHRVVWRTFEVPEETSHPSLPQRVGPRQFSLKSLMWLTLACSGVFLILSIPAGRTALGIFFMPLLVILPFALLMLPAIGICLYVCDKIRGDKNRTVHIDDDHRTANEPEGRHVNAADS
ncbi:MAG: hypothetical protein R3C10_24435 [Pirellulales bacterium]